MRARNIKPGFWKNEELAEIPYEARLLFIGLWGMADREGRLEDRPKRIRAEVFPFDTINIEKLLDVITLHGFILRYAAEDKRYIQIVKFEKHQHPHPHEAKSVIPRCNDMSCNVSLNPDVRNPDTMNPDVRNTPSRTKAVSGFEAIWAKYPRRVGKKAAEKSYKASVKNDLDRDSIEQALKTYLVSERVRGGFIQNGSTWFNNWQDWVKDPERGPKREAVRMPERTPEPTISDTEQEEAAAFFKQALGGLKLKTVPKPVIDQIV